MEHPNAGLNICPICFADGLEPILKFDQFSLMKCARCQSLWRSNMYDRNMVEQMYRNEEYARNPFFVHGDSSSEEGVDSRLNDYNKALIYAESQLRVGGRLLDVGCGTGSFLSTAEKRGWHTEGIELSPVLCEICSAKGFDVRCAFFEEADLAERLYDLVAFWDTIEHVLDPNLVIHKAKSLLAPGGMLLFCTPDEESFLARAGIALAKYARYYYPALALHPRYHTYFFGKHSFVNLLERHKMVVVKRYSKRAFFEHSSMASPAQKAGIEVIERIAKPFDACYDMVVFARSR